MNTNLTIKNFRVFDANNDADIKLAPITLLTGCNSSGKSSVVKALLLLKDFFKQMEEEKFVNCKLDFGNVAAKLGKFDVARNNASTSDGKITFGYTIYSQLLGERVEVVLTFAADEKDVLNDGWLSDILIKKLDGTVVFDAYLDKMTTPNMFKRISPDALQIRTNNLCAIKNNYNAYVLKCLTMDSLYRTEGLTEDNIENDPCISEALCELAQYVSERELALFVKQLKTEIGTIGYQCLPEMHSPSKYKRIGWLFGFAHKYKTLFPLPIWDVLEGVEKSEIRSAINSWIDKADKRHRTCLDKDVRGFLDNILTSFEMSEHDTLLAYFVAEEDKWLQDYQLQADYDNMGEDLTVRKISNFGKIPRVMNEHTFGSYTEEELILDDDSKGKLGNTKTIVNFNAKRFGDIFQTLYLVDEFKKSVSSDEPYDYMERIIDSIGWYGEDVHKVFFYFREYFADVMKELLSPAVFKAFEYVGDSAIETKRLYTREYGDLFGKVLFDYLDFVRTYKPIQEGFEVGSFINKWVKKFELGDHISIVSTAEGLGVVVKLHKTPNDKEGTLLADEGLGITKLIGTLINAELAILKSKDKGVTLAIEEPENHLHPKFQSVLAEMFADAYKNYGIHFIVETHSEYMVRKLQTLVARKELTPKEVSLQYFYSPDIEQRPQGEPQVKDIPIREDGILLAPFGPGFLDEADNLVTDILTLKAMS